MQPPIDGLSENVVESFFWSQSLGYDLPGVVATMDLPRKMAVHWLICLDHEISVPVRTKHAAFSHVPVVNVSPTNVPVRLAPTRNKWRQHQTGPLPHGYASANGRSTNTNICKDRKIHTDSEIKVAI